MDYKLGLYFNFDGNIFKTKKAEHIIRLLVGVAGLFHDPGVQEMVLTKIL